MLLRVLALVCLSCVVVLVDSEGPPCRDKQDIAFLIDSSFARMHKTGVVMAESLARSIAQNFTISREATRVAVVAFGYETKVKFYFDTYFTNEEVELQIVSDKWLNGTGRLGNGLKKSGLSVLETMEVMDFIFSPEFGSRDNVSRFLIFITNGEFKDKIGDQETKKLLKSLNVNMLVAGVGTEIDREFLESLVVDPLLDVFTDEEDNQYYMTLRIYELTDEFCHNLENPTVPMAPTNQPTVKH